MPSSALPPVVLYASLGGTISMTGSDGVTPSLDADDLIAGAGSIGRLARVETTTVTTIPGASLDFADLEQLLDAANRAVDGGAVGVVVSQGTDTIEETAFALDLRWTREEPLVVTGAMRSAHALSADGPANLRASMAAATDPVLRGAGVVVVLNDEIHAAAWVRKEHASALGAFRSHPGPLGYVVEGAVERIWSGARTRRVAVPVRDDVAVALIGTGVGDDGATFRAVAASGVDGIVIDAFGAAHLPQRLADAVAEQTRRLPVVVSSRTGAGRTLRSTYAFPGSERDLAERGAILSGWLDARKSRILLRSLLAAETPLHEVRDEFLSRSEL